ncbi:MAG: carboxypeptidase regulatory-like domain-containing protein [Planctomycetes bacterium]|nr:carboxypeptidase regulatory-like domain-containing protein [Planctomycetota bacterium]
MNARPLLLVALVALLATGAAAVWWAGAGPSPPEVEHDPSVAVASSDASREDPSPSPDRSSAARAPVAVAADTAPPRSLTVTLDDEQHPAPEDVRVHLLFAGGDPSRLQRLRPGRAGVATWTAGDGAPWPESVDLGFPTMGRHVVPVGDRVGVTLPVPATCVLDLEVRELDGLPSSDAHTVKVWIRGAQPPADRQHLFGIDDGRAEIPVEASGQRVQVEVETASRGRVTATFVAGRTHGERVPCVVELPTAGGVPFWLLGLPAADVPWRVDLFCFGGQHAVRAPRRGGTWLAFVAAAPPGDAPAGEGWFLDERAFVIAVRQGERRWGALRSRAATMQPFAEVARGRVVDAAGKGVEGVAIELRPAPDVTFLGDALLRVRTAADGSFEVPGPDPAEVPLALFVAATGERVDLPQPQPLLLRATR